jgi:hypothetical protein
MLGGWGRHTRQGPRSAALERLSHIGDKPEFRRIEAVWRRNRGWPTSQMRGKERVRPRSPRRPALGADKPLPPERKVDMARITPACLCIFAAAFALAAPACDPADGDPAAGPRTSPPYDPTPKDLAPAPQGECECGEIDAPVCGVDGGTYPSDCEAGCAGVDVDHEGPCEEPQNVACETDADCTDWQFCDTGVTCGGEGKCAVRPDLCIEDLGAGVRLRRRDLRQRVRRRGPRGQRGGRGRVPDLRVPADLPAGVRRRRPDLRERVLGRLRRGGGAARGCVRAAGPSRRGSSE